MALFKTKPKLRMGVVEKTELTFGSAGHQWTTIDGVVYATYWDAHTKKWTKGDTVVFETFTARLMGQSHKTLQANNIRKALPEDHPGPSLWQHVANALRLPDH